MRRKIKAVEMVRQVRDEHQKLLEGKSPDEIRAFYHERATKLNSRIKRLLDQEESQVRQPE